MESTFCILLSKINDLLWGNYTLVLIFISAIFLSARCKLVYIVHPVKLLKCTLFSKNVDNLSTKHTMSNFQTLTTALAASMGTGNIIGVAAAISLGGPGAVFWMIVSAFLVMSFAFTENVLATVYKCRSDSSDAFGALKYLSSFFGSDLFAVIFSFICMTASFFIGNITQVSSAANSLDNFHIPHWFSGIIFLILTILCVFHSRTNIASVTEKLVPFAAIFYIACSALIILIYGNNVYNVIKDIFSSAFGLKSFSGGLLGYSVSKTISAGVRRGLFSNEAGMGTSTFAHTSSDCKRPAVMGCWAALEVFIDTVLLCTLTSLVILSSGADKLGFSPPDTVLSAFEKGFEHIANLPFFSSCNDIFFANFGGFLLAFSNFIFAFASVIGWYFYGERCCHFIKVHTHLNCTFLYKILYAAAAFFGSVISTDIVWELADLFTFFMLIPNLTAILLLSQQIKPYLSLDFSNSDI